MRRRELGLKRFSSLSIWCWNDWRRLEQHSLRVAPRRSWNWFIRLIAVKEEEILKELPMRTKLKLTRTKYCTWRKLNEEMFESIIFRERIIWSSKWNIDRLQTEKREQVCGLERTDHSPKGRRCPYQHLRLWIVCKLLSYTISVRYLTHKRALTHLGV